MVKKKGKSKRTTLQDKYKIQKRTAETHRKRKKQAKKDAANGIIRHDKTKKDPGIPSSWPFKEDLLKSIQRAKERQQQLQQETKERRKTELKALREHQAQGGSARTVQELMEQAARDQASFQAKQGGADAYDPAQLKGDGTVAAGQQSRRAYLKELKKVIDSADVLLQVLDARDPVGSRIHPSIEDVILSRSDKRMVLVLNKIDLVPKDVVGAWLTTLRRSHPTIAIKASSHMSSGGTEDDATTATTSQSAVGMDCLLQLLKNYARTGGAGGKSKTTIVVGVVGYPNTGKSSIINALKRCRAVGVSSRPGFTTSMQEVVLDRTVRLLDSPGVVFDDHSAMLGNCVDAESMADPIPPVEALLKRCNHASLLMTYNIPTFPPGNAMMFLSLVAKSLGRVGKGGVPDKVAAARAVLKDWNQGKIPYFTVPPKVLEPEKATDAVIVSSFGAEFDLAKYDEEVLKSLKDKDEMDFVQLEDGTDTASEQRRNVSEDAIAMLTGNDEYDDEGVDSDDDSDEAMEDEEEDDDDDDVNPADKSLAKSRAALAKAEDYDFDMM